MSHIIHNSTHTDSYSNGSQSESSDSSTASTVSEEFDLYKYMSDCISAAKQKHDARTDVDNRSVYERFKLPLFTLNGTVVNDKVITVRRHYHWH